MIRLLQRRLIIPRGDTGSFTVPLLSQGNTDNIAVFTIFDELTRTRLFQKIIQCEGDVMNVAFTHNDTVNLKPGKYLWDIKFYQNPQFVDEELVNGDEVDSYYAGFSLPVCEIRETADNYLVSPDAPTAMLTPEQLDIITGAISSLNEAIEKTQSNVEHYPIVRDEVWYTWDAETQDYVSTGVRANGIVGPAGTGISSVVLNDDYTLTLNLTDGTSFTSTSIRGEVGNGIDDIVLNSDYTLTIRYTNGEVYTTPSIRGAVGATPQFSIGTVQDGAVAAATITGTAENPVLNLTLPNAHVPTRVSQLENDANYAVDANYIHTDNNYTTAEKEKLNGIAAGAEVNVNADWNATSGDARILNKPTNISAFENDAGYLTTETDPTVPAWAKAAQKPTYTAEEVGAPTVAEMNTAIGEAISQINSFDMAIVQALPTQDISTHTIYLVPKTGETNDVYDEYVYINNSWEMIGNTQIDLSNYATKDELPDVPVQDVQVDGTSILQEGVANVPIATSLVPGVAIFGSQNGIQVSSKQAMIVAASTNDIKLGGHSRKPIVPSMQHYSVFWGLAKAAGDTTQSQSNNDAGQYTDEAKTAIQTMLDVPAKSDIPDVPVQDIKVNGTSILDNGMANIPIASTNNLGVVKVNMSYGIGILEDGTIGMVASSNSTLKQGISNSTGITPGRQHTAVFYGLAKAAGHDEASSTEPVGTYTPEAKGAIQSMLGVSDLIATAENSLVASKAYAIGDVFTANGKLYKATAAIAADAAIILQNEGEEVSGHNAEECKVTDYAVHDVQINGTSVLNNGIANIQKATTSSFGVVKILSGGGIDIGSTSQALYLKIAPLIQVKAGTNGYNPIMPENQHQATFYGLAKAAGDTTQSQSDNAVGTYTDNAKASIKSMLGIQDGSTGTVDVSGAAPTITAVENTRYVCGEVTSLDFTPAASGVCIVRFTSGSTPTLLTLPSTVKFPEWFDSTALETDTIYEMCITDGIYGAVMSWAL